MHFGHRPCETDAAAGLAVKNRSPPCMCPCACVYSDIRFCLLSQARPWLSRVSLVPSPGLPVSCFMNASPTTGGSSASAASLPVWCSEAFWRVSSSCLSSGKAANADNILRTILKLHMRCCVHLRRLRIVRFRCRLLVKLLSERGRALVHVRDMAAMLLVCLREERISEHPVLPSEVAADPEPEVVADLEPLHIDVRVLTDDLVDHQTKLVRGMWLGNYLQTKLCRDHKRSARLLLSYARLRGAPFAV